MRKLIDADAAIESLAEYGNGRAVYISVEEAVRRIEQLPSAEPDTTTHDSIPAETGKNDSDRTSGDYISRTQAIDFVGSMNMCDEISNEAYKKLTSYLDELPSIQPDLDEWCTDCKEYDSDKHCCPRFNRVIRGALNEAQPERKTGRWIPDNTDYYRTKFICSACGESEEVPTTGFGYGTMWDYCPMCGAKMERGEQE